MPHLGVYSFLVSALASVACEQTDHKERWRAEMDRMPMWESELFRRRSEACFAMAHRATDPCYRLGLLEMAQRWAALADQAATEPQFKPRQDDQGSSSLL
jgi:hypothetical protein